MVTNSIVKETAYNMEFQKGVAFEKNPAKLTNQTAPQLEVKNVNEIILNEEIEISEEAYQKWLETAQEEKELLIKQNYTSIFIPNIQTNHLLRESLEDASFEVVNAAYETIHNNLLKSNVGNMKEEERHNLIALGLEKAKYIADNYLSKEQAGKFLSAMETVAKYGMNGVKDENGRVTFNIQQGPLAGAPDDYVNSYEVMKEASPETYNRYQTLKQEYLTTNDSNKLLEAKKIASNWIKNAHMTNPSLFKNKAEQFAEWKQTVNETKLPTAFSETDIANKSLFMNSLLKANEQHYLMNTTYLEDNLYEFFSLLNE